MGDWVITDHLAPSMSEMPPEEARRWYGTPVAFTATNAGLLAENCTAPVYEPWTVSQRHFESDYGLSPDRLGIVGDSIRIVRIECKSGVRGRGAELFVLSHDQLIFSMRGVFFLLKRAAK